MLSLRSSSRVKQAPPLGFGDDVTVLPSSFQPKGNRLVSVPQGIRMRGTMGHTARKLGDVSDKRLILIAPEDDDLVPMRH